jgi:hypothetical protein
MKKYIEVNKELLEKIISAAYGEAGFIDKMIVLSLVKKNERIREIFNEYKKTAESLNSLQHENCPDEIISRVYSETGAGTGKISIIEKLRLQIFSKPIYAAAIILILTVTTFILLFRQPEPRPQYTKAEIAMAEKQVKQTMVFVSNIFKKTGNNLENNILPAKVGKPFNNGLNTVKNILNGG